MEKSMLIRSIRLAVPGVDATVTIPVGRLLAQSLRKKW
jgi:hypothetical protein